jgi:PAS domain S-box-containing protein
MDGLQVARAILWAAGSVSLVILVRAVLTPVLGHEQAYLLFVPAIALAAVRAGALSGLLALALGGLAGTLLFAGPPADAVPARLALYSLVGAGILAIGAAERRSRERLQRALAERAHAPDAAPLAPANDEGGGRGEQAHSGSDPSLDMVAQSTGLMVWMAGADGTCEWFNRDWLQFTGRTLEEELADGCAASVHPDDVGRRREAFEAALAEREPFEVETRLRRADGCYRWMLDRGLPRFAADGTFAGYIGTCIDMHDRRDAERRDRLLAQAANIVASATEIEDALEQVAALAVPLLADVCLVHVTATAGAGALRFANTDAEQDTLLKELRTRYPPPASVPCFPTVLRTGESMVLAELTRPVLELTAVDDLHLELMSRLNWRSALCVPLRARGKVLGVVGLANATDRAPLGEADLAFAVELAQYLAAAVDSGLLLREAKASYEQVLESSRLKDEFLATLSHELRTPLNAIVGWSRLLMDGQLSETDAARAVETIHRNAAAQNQLIADMLDVSRIVSGKLRLDLREVDPAAVIGAAVDTVLPAAHAKGIALQTVLDPGAGPITGDPDRLQQVIWNLLSNAIKFTHRGGRVLLRLEKQSSHVAITVEDNGPGMDPGFLPYVFDRFRQADSSSTRRQGGLGLGLAIVRHLVELHGGTVQAENRAGGGAIFSIHLPRRAVSAGPAAAERHPAQEGIAAPAAISLEGVTVLAVDDKQDSLDLVSAVLERRGAHVFTALSSAQGLDMLIRERPDVVLADIEMPGQDGLTFIRKVRVLPPGDGGRVPAAALTAYASSNDRTQALLAGFDMHVPKPVQPDELAAVVARLAGRDV